MLWMELYSAELFHIQSKQAEITPALRSLYRINNDLCPNGFVYDPWPGQPGQRLSLTNRAFWHSHSRVLEIFKTQHKSCWKRMVMKGNISGGLGHGALWRHLKPHTCSLPSACLGIPRVQFCQQIAWFTFGVLSSRSGRGWKNTCACLVPNNAARVCWLIGSSRLNWIQHV